MPIVKVVHCTHIRTREWRFTGQYIFFVAFLFLCAYFSFFFLFFFATDVSFILFRLRFISFDAVYMCCMLYTRLTRFPPATKSKASNSPNHPTSSCVEYDFVHFSLLPVFIQCTCYISLYTFIYIFCVMRAGVVKTSSCTHIDMYTQEEYILYICAVHIWFEWKTNSD